MMRTSVIIPVYNGDKYLADAIDSVLDQTVVPDEIIVVDDGSSDGSGTVAGGYGAKVRLFRQENAGPATARNLGVTEALGDVLAFLDADDLWHPTKLEKQLEALERCDLAFCTVAKFFSEDCPPEINENASERDQPGYLPSALVCWAGAFDRVGPFDKELRSGEFIDWLARARELEIREIHLDEPLVRRRIHAGNMTRDSGVMQEYLRVIRRNLERQKTS